MSKRRRPAKPPQELPLFDFPIDRPSTGGESAPPEPPASAPASSGSVSPEDMRKGTPVPAESAGLGASVGTEPPRPRAAPVTAVEPSVASRARAASVDESPAGPTPVAVPPATVPDDDLPVSGERAPLRDRLFAGLTDLALHLLVLGAAVAAAVGLGVPVTLTDWPSFALFLVLFSFPYWVIPLAFWGQTPGMTWIGLLSRTSDGDPLSFGQATLRWIGALLTCLLMGLPLILALRGNSLSDLISDSESVVA